MSLVPVLGTFDDLRSEHIRYLEEAAKLGDVEVELYTDEAIAQQGLPPAKYPFEERRYLLESLRYVRRVVPAGPPVSGTAFSKESPAAIPVPAPPSVDPASGRKRVIVTGCFDWFHSGHVRFFEEASAYGDLYVGVGSDANVRALKGEGHPLLPENVRAYMVQAVRYVKQAFVSSGDGWLDAEPEIAVIRPHFYIVNEDGDRPEKRAFCRNAGIEYIVLHRAPKPGLPRRESTRLRGF
jgi:cytidyltransferase-like protein